MTVGILALHYVTSEPIEKQLGFRKGPRPISTAQSPIGHKLPSNVAAQATTEPQMCAGDHDANQDVISVPNRIFVRKTYDVQFVEPHLPSSNTTPIDRKHLAEEVEEVEEAGT